MNAITFLEPVFRWWDRFSDANPGIGFIAFVYGAVLLLVWMFSQLRPTRPWPDAVTVIIVHRSQPPPPIIKRRREPFDDDDSDSFAA